MVTNRLPRRSVLVGAGTLGFAGCLGNGEDDRADSDADDEILEADVRNGRDDDGDTGDGDDATAPDEASASDLEVVGSPLDAHFDVSVVVENLEIPWDMAIAADGDVFVTERPGRIRRMRLDDLDGDESIDATELYEEPVPLPGLSDRTEGGALGLTLHHGYPDPPYVYVFYTADESSRIDRVIRFDATSPTETETIVDDLPGARTHNGGRIAFGPDDRLWITRGDVREPELSQDPGSLAGALLRVTDEGQAAGSNDAPDDADPRVVTYGHRNMQGIDWLPDGTPIATDHGPTARDEVLLLTPGRNYGWPVARGGPDDPDYDSYGDGEVFAPPIASSGTEETWAPSGGTWYAGETFPNLRNRFLFAGLRSQRIHVLTLLDPGTQPPNDATMVHDDVWLDDRYLAVRHELFAEEFGRIRQVTTGPDGEIYFLTSNEDDVIVRLTPS